MDRLKAAPATPVLVARHNCLRTAPSTPWHSLTSCETSQTEGAGPRQSARVRTVT